MGIAEEELLASATNEAAFYLGEINEKLDNLIKLLNKTPDKDDINKLTDTIEKLINILESKKN